jgi:hypothetical protein
MKIEVCDLCESRVYQALPEYLTALPVQGDVIKADIGRVEIRVVLRAGKALCPKCLQEMVVKRIEEVQNGKGH